MTDMEDAIAETIAELVETGIDPDTARATVAKLEALAEAIDEVVGSRILHPLVDLLGTRSLGGTKVAD